jgi:type IV pilus assembly protein PilC
MARMSTRRLARLCHNVGTGLHAGLDIRRMWDSQVKSASGSERPHLDAIRRQIDSGEGLAASFKASNGFFPPLLCEMVEVGERTGRLEQVFFRLAQHYDRVVNLRRNFLIGIAWPMFELTLGVLFIGLFIYLLGMLGTNMSLWGMQGFSGAMTWYLGAAVVAAAIAAPFVAIRNGWLNPDPVYRVLIRVPGIGTGFRIFSMSRLTWSLAMATDSDLSADKAIELAVRTTQNSYYTDHLERMKQHVRQGGEMHEAFRLAGVYPADFLDALQTGELAGRTVESLNVVAKDYEERATHWYRGLAFVCGILVFLAVAGLMIFMIVNLFVNMYLQPINDALNEMQ